MTTRTTVAMGEVATTRAAVLAAYAVLTDTRTGAAAKAVTRTQAAYDAATRALARATKLDEKGTP